MIDRFKTWYRHWKALRADPERPRTNFGIDLFWDLCNSIFLRIGVPRGFRFVDWLVALSEGPESPSTHPKIIAYTANGLALIFFFVSASNTVSKLLIALGKSNVSLWKKKDKP